MLKFKQDNVGVEHSSPVHNVAKPTSFPLLLLHYCKQVIAVEDVTACAVGVCVLIACVVLRLYLWTE